MRGTILCSGDVCFGGGESGGVQIQGFQTEAAAAAAFWSNLEEELQTLLTMMIYVLN